MVGMWFPEWPASVASVARYRLGKTGIELCDPKSVNRGVVW